LNPCPDGCAPDTTWADYDFSDQFPSGDTPWLIDDINNDNMWFTAARYDGNNFRVTVGRFTDLGGAGYDLDWWQMPESGCFGSSNGKNMFQPRGVMVQDDIWISYRNFDDDDIEFVKFDTATTSFPCLTQYDIDPTAPMPIHVSCSLCSDYMMPDVANGCKRSDYTAAIDVSNPNTATPVAVVPFSQSGCTDEYEQRIRRSTNGGSVWTEELITGCQTGTHASVAFARTPESGITSSSTVHVMSMHEHGTSPSGRSGLRPVKWVSIDNGNNWSGVFMGTQQVTFPTVPGIGAGCYWGDYDGVVADMANNTMLYFWADGENDGDPHSVWAIRTQGVNP
jgi:hypothetical protein